MKATISLLCQMVAEQAARSGTSSAATWFIPQHWELPHFQMRQGPVKHLYSPGVILLGHPAIGFAEGKPPHAPLKGYTSSSARNVALLLTKRQGDMASSRQHLLTSECELIREN